MFTFINENSAGLGFLLALILIVAPITYYNYESLVIQKYEFDATLNFVDKRVWDAEILFIKYYKLDVQAKDNSTSLKPVTVAPKGAK